MNAGKNARTAQQKVDGEWHDIHPLAITAGMTFRMFEPDGKPVTDGFGNTEFYAEADCYVNIKGVYEVPIGPSH